MKRINISKILLNTFGDWDRSIHQDPEQQKRIKKAVKLNEFSAINRKNKCAVYQGSHAEPYQVTLNSCTCPDFQERGIPCKHIYRLAIRFRKFSPDKKIYTTWQFWVGILYALVILITILSIPKSIKDSGVAETVTGVLSSILICGGLVIAHYFWAAVKVTKLTNRGLILDRNVPIQSGGQNNYSFSALPIDTSGYNRRGDPTERQMEYANNIGLIVPQNADIDDVSAMLSRVEDNDLDPPPIGLVQYLQQLGAQPSPYIGKLATVAAIRSRLQGAGAPAFYAYAVHCSMQGAPIGNMSLSPYMQAYYAFGNEVLGNDRFMKSLEGRPDADYYEPNRSTAAYIVAEEYLRKLS